MNYLPLTIMAILFVDAIIIKLINKKDMAKLLSLAGLAISAVLSVIMLANVYNTGTPIELRLLEAARPINIVVSVGIVEALIVMLFCTVGMLIVWSSFSMIEYEVEQRKLPMHYSMATLLVGSIIGVIIFGNLINTYVFMELSTFVAAAAIMIKNDKESHHAGIRYITLSIMGSAFVLMGMVIVYTMTGSYEVAVIRENLPAAFAAQPNSLLYAMIFITVGGAFKSALFPFHIWSPNAYTYAPAPVSAMLSGLVSKPYIIFYLNTCYKMIGTEIMHQYPMVYILKAIMLMGVLGMVLGSFLAIIQSDIKRMTAYSSVAQIGYIFMGIGLGSPLGLIAAIYHIVTHILTKSMLFLITGLTSHKAGNRKINNLYGVGIEMPVTMALYTVGAMSMIGIPLFMGFVSKYNFALGIMESNNWWVMFILVLSGLLNIIYYLPISLRGYFGKVAQEKMDQGRAFKSERKLSETLPILILGIAVVALGIFSSGLLEIITKGVSSLF